MFPTFQVFLHILNSRTTRSLRDTIAQSEQLLLLLL